VSGIESSRALSVCVWIARRGIAPGEMQVGMEGDGESESESEEGN
jgi:hypothetical protein